MKQAMLSTAQRVGLFALARKASASRLRILCYHGLWTTPGFEAGVMPADQAKTIPEGQLHEIVAHLAQLSGKSYSPTGAASPWSHEGVRLGIVILVFNLGLLAVVAAVGRRSANQGGV